MSAHSLKGTTTWILGFLALLAVINAFNALILINSGVSEAGFRVFGSTFGSMDAEAYFWLSIVFTFIFFSMTVISIYRGLPSDPRLLDRLSKVEEGLTLASNMLENTQIGFFKKLEENEKANEEIFRKTSVNMEEMKKENTENLAQQKSVLQSIVEETRRNSDSVRKQATDLAAMKKSISELGKDVLLQKPRLTSRSEINKFKSIAPGLATKLNEMKIETVSDLLTADASTIAQKASEMVETIADKQAEAQLLMIPGISDEQARLLVKVGITSRRELANQDPVQLYRGIAGIAKALVVTGEMPANKIPTIEDITEWTRVAKL